MRNLPWFALSVRGLADSGETLRVMPAGAARRAADGRDWLREVCAAALYARRPRGVLTRKNIVYGIPVILAA
jgi:hypothetical protein